MKRPSEGNDKVIENWRSKAWEILKKDKEGQLTQEEFTRLFTELVSLRPDLRNQEYFSTFVKVMPKCLELDDSEFSKIKEFMIEVLKEALR